MKKSCMLAVLLLTMATVLTGCGDDDADDRNSTAGATSQDNKSNHSKGDVISEEEAKKIALDHAGVTEDGITFVKVKLELDDGVEEYEVEFYTQDTEYDYTIDAVSGEIRSNDNELENRAAANGEGQAAITIEEATTLALEKVPGATNANIRIKEDKDDGRSVYEGTILYEGKEYDFEINAATGEFNDWEVD